MQGERERGEIGLLLLLVELWVWVRMVLFDVRRRICIARDILTGICGAAVRYI